MARFLIPPILALLASGCVGGTASGTGGAHTTRVDPVALSEVAGAAARQVRRCYRHPKVPSAGRRIVTRLRVHLRIDGALAQPPQIVFQQGVTEENRMWAPAM